MSLKLIQYKCWSATNGDTIDNATVTLAYDVAQAVELTMLDWHADDNSCEEDEIFVFDGTDTWKVHAEVSLDVWCSTPKKVENAASTADGA